MPTTDQKKDVTINDHHSGSVADASHDDKK